MTGREAYEEDCRRCPTYHNGEKRLAWEHLGRWCQATWDRNPTPREYRGTAPDYRLDRDAPE